MDDKEEGIIEKLILDGGLETVGVDQETGELLYSFTPKIKNLMPDLYDEHMTEVNSCVMNLWEKGFLEIDFFAEEPIITLSKKAFDRAAIEGLSKKDRWNLFEIIRLLNPKA
jgi:hypothetical protein